jgi:hypothetical protein
MLDFGSGGKDPVEGIWEVEDEQYYADTSAISCSMLQCFMDGPRAFESRYILKNEPKEEESPSFLLGRAFHEYILRPARFLQEFIIAPKFGRTKAELAKKAEWYEQNNEKSVITEKQLTQIKNMKIGLMRNKIFARYLQSKNAKVEVAYRELYSPLDYEFTGQELKSIWRKCKYDLIVPGEAIIDIKTIASLDDASVVEKSFLKYKYHCRDAWYMDIAKRFKIADKHLFCFVEKKWPHNTRIFYIDYELTDLGRRENDKALIEFQSRMENNFWEDPWESKDPHRIEIPYWKRQPFFECEETDERNDDEPDF